MAPEYTLVCGVDAKHLEQLATVWPTWQKHKPSLLEHPWLVFYDQEQLTFGLVLSALFDHPNLQVVPWPPDHVKYEGVPGDKWRCPQRYKMLAGFVYVPAYCVKTPYWLKLDCDVVAIGQDDWIDPSWFDEMPAIISHPWTFTKPPDQMMKLDQWVKTYAESLPLLTAYPPLDMVPEPGADRLGHKRIISWCAFFNTDFTRTCSWMAEETCGEGKLPVPSQDGYMWYCAKRMELEIVRASMKKRGWQQWLTGHNIRKYAKEAMQ